MGIDAESCPPAGTGLRLGRFQRNACAVRHASDRIESGDDCSGVDHCLRPDAGDECRPRHCQIATSADSGVGEGEQLRLMANATAAVAFDDTFETVVSATVSAAPPEQGE